MKTTLLCPLTTAALVAGVSFNVLAGPSPGQVDFGNFTAPDGGGEFVEIQINSNLLSLAAQTVEQEAPEVGKLLRNVELIRVNVIGLSDANRADMVKRVRQIRQDLEAQGWDKNVSVQEKNGQDVGIYSKTRGNEALAGLAVTVVEPKGQVVLINIVGNIRPEQVAVLGDKLDLKPLKEIGKALKEAAPKEAAAKTEAPKK